MTSDWRRIQARDKARFREALMRADGRQGRLEWVLRRVIRGLCRAVAWRVGVDGVANLPAVTSALAGSGCVVACAPHRTWLEPFLLLHAWPPGAARLVWMADGRTVSRSAWRRRLLPEVGVIPIEGRFGGPAEYLEVAGAALAAGAALVVFPERGPASSPHRTRPMAPGFAYIARSAGAPVIPVVVAGTHDVRRGSHYSVTFLSPIEAGPPDAASLSRASRSRAHDLTTRTAHAINAELPERNALTDAAAPAVSRWRWLASLLR